MERLPWSDRPNAELRRLATPMVLALLATTVLSVTDTWLVGRHGAAPLAAAGLGNTATFTVTSFSLALFGALKVKVGEAYGRGDRERVAEALHAFLSLAGWLGTGTLIVGFLVAELVGTVSREPAVGALARTYIDIRILSVLPVVFSAALGNHLQGQGQPRLPMLASLLGTLVHLPLSAFLVLKTPLGPLGAAVAYVVSRLAELGLLVFGRSQGETRRRSTAMTRKTFFRVGLTTAVERLLDMAAFAMVPLLLAGESAVSVAGHQITLQLSQLSFLPLVALSESVSILVSQSVGARRTDLIPKVSRTGFAAAILYASLLASLFFLIPRKLAGFFTTDPAVIDASEKALFWAGVLQLINSVYGITKGILRGLSEFNLVAWVAVACAWGVTPPLTYYLGRELHLGARGAWMGLTLEVSLGLLLLVPRVRRTFIAPEKLAISGKYR